MNAGGPLRVRSGWPPLDAAIASFLAGTLVSQNTGVAYPAAWLADPEWATDLCAEVTEAFVQHAAAAGVHAFAAMDTADGHGYAGRARNGSGWLWHDLAVVPVPELGCSFAADFTASQYGYPALPFVRRAAAVLDERPYEPLEQPRPAGIPLVSWQRAWEPAGALQAA